MFYSSARILSSKSDPTLRTLQERASDDAVALVFAAQFCAHAQDHVGANQWRSIANEAVGSATRREAAEHEARTLGCASLLDRAVSWWWLGVVAVVRERDLDDRMLRTIGCIEAWQRSPSRHLIETLLVANDARGAAHPELAWQIADVFCPELAALLPRTMANAYAEAFVEASLHALTNLDDVAEALERAEISRDADARQLVRGLQGNPLKSGTITQRFASGEAERVRTCGSKQWKRRQTLPRDSAPLFLLAALVTGVNHNYVKQWCSESAPWHNGFGVRACLAFDQGSRADARTLLTAYRTSLDTPDSGRVLLADVANVVAACWVERDIGAHPRVALMQSRCEQLQHTMLANLLQQVRDAAAGHPSVGCAGRPGFAGLRQSREAWQDAVQLLEKRAENATALPTWAIEARFNVVQAAVTLTTKAGKKPKRFDARQLYARGEMMRPEVPWTIGERALASLAAARPYENLHRDELPLILELLEGRSVTLNGQPLTVSRPQLVVNTTESGAVQVEIEAPVLPTGTGRHDDDPTERLPARVKRGDDGYTLLADDAALREVEAAAGNRFEIPAGMRDHFFDLLRTSGMHVHGAEQALQTERNVVANATPTLRIAPRPAGLYVRAFVRPFGADGPQFVPGAGVADVAHVVSDQRLTTTRDLAAEAAVFAPFSPLFPADTDVEEHSTVLVDDEALAFLAMVRDNREQLHIEWPKNKPLRLPQQVPAASFDFRTEEPRGWLELHGEARFDEGQVVSFADLIRSQRGRFATLSDGRVLELDDTLQQQLVAARRLGTVHGGSVRFSPHVALAEQSESLPLGETFHARREDLQDAFAKTPRVPTAFCGTLMPYQRDGYRWLARLADAELGACLADDMGLGKTIQTLALLLRRASLGPALVVAPTSVATNWMDEVLRFAPSLNCVDGRTERERAASPKAGDIVITSYGLLRRDEERYQSTQWATAVLDEAQAIKNPATQQARAAFSLNASMRVACTGTPVENRLDELWSIFRFVLPGHLGSRESFSNRFGRPIAEGDTDAAAQLQALIEPFLLRRTKAEVLRDLPEKTERVQRIRMSDDEAAFYEATRLMAEQQVEEIDPTGGNRMMVLAQITKLRLACCSPALLEQSESVGLKKARASQRARVPSSKVDALSEALDSISQSGHHALVFTQFVGFLRIVQERLIEDGLRVARLDGSTPAKKRAQLVERFQNGEFDVFLISLKAGGTGLNLTRASYVFLLDPWWNPAVENQAADRAHRIGQQMPVTITRYVCAGTIEEKILELHREKRELADAVIGDGAASTALSVERLLSLIREAT